MVKQIQPVQYVPVVIMAMPYTGFALQPSNAYPNTYPSNNMLMPVSNPHNAL